MANQTYEYRSKIDHGLYYGVIGLTALSGLPILFIDDFIPKLVFGSIILLTIWFIHSSFYNTYYTINPDKDSLIIRASFLINQTISIQNIIKIKKTNSMLSAPAASMDRIEIRYQHGTVVISPEERRMFIDHLLKINPNIEVGPKLRNQ